MRMTDLTERYLDEVARHLPQDRQNDIRAELRGLITDTVESRSVEPHDRRAAEHDVLTEMGEPSGLAASYSDWSQRLIGPGLYSRYIQLLKILLGTILPLFVVGNAVLGVSDGVGFAEILLSSLFIALNIGAQVFTVVTVVFAALERTGRTNTRQWTLFDLPERSPTSSDKRNTRRAPVGLCVSIAVQIMIFALILWQQYASPYTTEDRDQVPILNPELFSGWMWPILAGLAGVIVLDLVRTSGRAWDMRLAWLYTAPQALFFLPLAWVFSQQLIFDQRFLVDFNNGWQTPDAFYTAVALVLIAWVIITTIDQFRLARKL